MITDRQFVLDPAILSAVNLAAIKKQKKKEAERMRKIEREREKLQAIIMDE